MLVVDTSVWIDFLGGRRSHETNRLAAALTDDEPVAVPGVVVSELLMGIHSDRECGQITDLLGGLETLPELQWEDYRAAADLYRRCRVRGATIRSTVDCLIAQSCLKGGHELLTRDRDFTEIAKISALKLA